MKKEAKNPMGKKVIKNQIPKNNDVEKILIENFVSLQKVMTNLSFKFDELSTQISKLLELFELSANALAKKEVNLPKPIDEKRIFQGLENLSNQNKIIARGLTLIYGGAKQDNEIASTSSPFNNQTAKGEYRKSPFSQGL